MKRYCETSILSGKNPNADIDLIPEDVLTDISANTDQMYPSYLQKLAAGILSKRKKEPSNSSSGPRSRNSVAADISKRE